MSQFPNPVPEPGHAGAYTFDRRVIQLKRRLVREATQAAFNILVWPLSYILCALILALVYRFGADRKNVRWRWITWGSAIASALWIAGTVLFSWYVQNYGSYNRTYGALGSVIGRPAPIAAAIGSSIK